MNFTPAMACRIELWPLDRLKPYAKNARTRWDCWASAMRRKPT